MDELIKYDNRKDTIATVGGFLLLVVAVAGVWALYTKQSKQLAEK